METWKCETNKSKINASENCVEKITPRNTMDFDPEKTSEAYGFTSFSGLTKLQ